MKLNQSCVVVNLVALAFTTGCNTVEEPVIEDYLSADLNREIGTMASVASRRLTVVRLNHKEQKVKESGGEDDGEDDDEWARGEFCSEPSPDAMVAATEQWTAKLAELKDVTVDAQLVQSVASSMGPLVYRTQGLQWNRDSMAFACMDYMNRRIEKKKYAEWIESIREESVKLIMAELPNMPKVTWIFQNVTAPRETPAE